MKSSKTLTNLARSFAGESQAGLRYQMIAEMCMQQGYKTLADELKTIAKNEVKHAKNYYDLLTGLNGTAKNIEIAAGYPFEKLTIEDGLKFSVSAEHEEAENLSRICEDRAGRRIRRDREKIRINRKSRKKARTHVQIPIRKFQKRNAFSK